MLDRRRTRRRSPDDHRLDWRDPNMPVLLRMAYGNVWRLEEVSPRRASKLAQAEMNDPNMLPWYRDPTYNMRKQGR